MRERQTSPTSTVAILSLMALVTSFVLVAGAAPAQVRVTSLEGDLRADRKSLSLHQQLTPDQRVELPENGRGSFLIEDNTLIRLCDGAKASFTGAGQVELSQGQLGATFAARPGEFPLEIRTPTATIAVLGDAVHVMVEQRSGDTTVSSLRGNMRVTRGGASVTESRLIDTDEQVSVTKQTIGQRRRFESNELAKFSDCLDSGIHRSSALEASSRMLFTQASDLKAETEDASGFESDLAQIVAADFPTDGVPFEAASTPSALIAELNKAGLDEEVCDPITCNPVFQLPEPEFCGVPPVTGCIPRP